jgi:hypothetical protein
MKMDNSKHLHFLSSNSNGDPAWTGPGWYYSDEAEQINGPFPTREDADQALNQYLVLMNESCNEQMAAHYFDK